MKVDNKTVLTGLQGSFFIALKSETKLRNKRSLPFCLFSILKKKKTEKNTSPV